MSTIERENTTMSPEADVAFMGDTCDFIVERRAKGLSVKQQLGVIISQFRTRDWEPSENRVYEWLKRRCRRIDGYEKERGHQVKAKIEAEDAQTRHADHLQWLKAEIERHRATGQGIRGPHVDGLEHFLRVASDGGSALDRLDEETLKSRNQGE